MGLQQAHKRKLSGGSQRDAQPRRTTGQRESADRQLSDQDDAGVASPLHQTQPSTGRWYLPIKLASNYQYQCQGRNWVILRGGRRYIYNRKDEIIHGLSPSVKCVSPLFRDMSLAKV